MSERRELLRLAAERVRAAGKDLQRIQLKQRPGWALSPKSKEWEPCPSATVEAFLASYLEMTKASAVGLQVFEEAKENGRIVCALYGYDGPEIIAMIAYLTKKLNVGRPAGLIRGLERLADSVNDDGSVDTMGTNPPSQNPIPPAALILNALAAYDLEDWKGQPTTLLRKYLLENRNPELEGTWKVNGDCSESSVGTTALAVCALVAIDDCPQEVGEAGLNFILRTEAPWPDLKENKARGPGTSIHPVGYNTPFWVARAIRVGIQKGFVSEAAGHHALEQLLRHFVTDVYPTGGPPADEAHLTTFALNHMTMVEILDVLCGKDSGRFEDWRNNNWPAETEEPPEPAPQPSWRRHVKRIGASIAGLGIVGTFVWLLNITGNLASILAFFGLST